MNMRQFKGVLRSYLDANITVQIMSAPGIGKSEGTNQAVAEYNKAEPATRTYMGKSLPKWGITTVMLATYTPSDVLGYLIPGKQVVNDKEVRISEFTMPPWMISDEGIPMNEYDRGVVFVDEWDKADPDVKRAFAEVLLNRRAGKWQLHKGIGVVVASNRSQDRSGSTKEFDFIINRRAEIHIQPDVKAWEDWAVRTGVNPLFITFALKNPGIVFEGKVPEKQGPFCTPRSLVMASKLLEGKFDKSGALPLGDEAEEAMISEMVSGLIGSAPTNHLLTWCKLKTEVPDFDDIVKDPAGTEIPPKPDAKMLIAYECAHRCTIENAEKVVDYALRLPKEFQVTFGAAAIKRNHRLLAAKGMKDKFIPKNAALINLIGQ
jgi:hypothetical protein